MKHPEARFKRAVRRAAETVLSAAKLESIAQYIDDDAIDSLTEIGDIRMLAQMLCDFHHAELELVRADREVE